MRLTDEQKKKIENMRRGGLGYRRIAGAMGLSPYTVRDHIARIGLRELKSIAGLKITDFCPVCGSRMEMVPHKRKKLYCSDKCRVHAWYRSNNKNRSN